MLHNYKKVEEITIFSHPVV